MVCVQDGQPRAAIVVADQPLPIPLWSKGKQLTVAYAAEELQRFIEKASGARLEIVPASRAPAAGALLLVGRNALSERLGLRLPGKAEGLRIAGFDRGAAILGEVAPRGTGNVDYEVDRGTLAGVYEFLERIVGYRFFLHVKEDPELGIVTPAVRHVTVPAGYALELAPDFPFRAGGYKTWGDPLAWMRVTRSGAGTGFVGANHTDMDWSRRFPPKEHATMYALHQDGTRDSHWPCYSAPETLEGRLQKIEAFYQSPKYVPMESLRLPGPCYIPFEPDDLWDWKGQCTCDRCRAAVRPDRGRFGLDSELLFGHGIAAAREIQKRWPGKRLVMLAYEGHMLPPAAELPENLDVQVCMMWSSTMGKEDYWHRRNVELLRDWSRKVGGRRERLYLWDYYCWPSQWTSAPVLFPHYLRKWLQETRSLASGEFICPGGNPPQFELFMCWIWHRLMWDCHADVDSLLHDHAATFFGPAAAPMEELYRTLIDRYENVRWSRRFEASYLPPDQIYGETYTPEVVVRLKRLMSDALAACPIDPCKETNRKGGPDSLPIGVPQAQEVSGKGLLSLRDPDRQAIRATQHPAIGHAGINKEERDLYRRRVAWMQEGLSPFFEEADLAHRWLGHAPVYVVRTSAAAPQDKDWNSASEASLAEGNYGGKPDLATRVAMIRHGSDLWLRCWAEEPTPLADGDLLRLTIKHQGRERTLTLGPGGVSEGAGSPGLPVALLSNQHRDGWWRIEVKLPAGELGSLDGQAGSLPVQIERHRAHRGAGKGLGTDYFWMPPMKPPWGSQFRFGQIRFGN